VPSLHESDRQALQTPINLKFFLNDRNFADQWQCFWQTVPMRRATDQERTFPNECSCTVYHNHCHQMKGVVDRRDCCRQDLTDVRQMLEKLTDSDLTPDTGTTVIHPVKCVRDLGVHLDSELTMKTHISKVASSCYHQLRRIHQVRWLVGQDVAQQLVSAFILSRLDYCNSLLSRLPKTTIQPLQRVMNAAARVIVNLSLRDHVKPALKQLHGCRSSTELHTSCVCSCTTSISDRHHNTCQTVCPQLLKPVADTGWGRLAQRLTFCQEQELDLENVVSSTPVRRLEHFSIRSSWHHLHYYFQKMTQECTFWTCLSLTTVGAPGRALLDVSYSGALQILRWLIDWLMGKIYGQGYLEFYTIDDGEPVQLLQCWPDVVPWR